ncbi:MAG: PsbP-related protein [Dehalococcoidales bacterium]|nr:PsbP-related protein [Dehalococcoidales bacterium]
MKKAKCLSIVRLLVPVVIVTMVSGCITVVNPSAGSTTDIPEETPSQEIEPAFTTYTDNVTGFSISYPSGWERVPQESLGFGELVAFWDYEEGKGFPPYMSIKNEQLAEEMSLDTYSTLAQQAGTIEAGLAFISSEEFSVNGERALKHYYTFSADGIDTKMMQVYLIEGQTVWIINFMSVPEAFDSVEPTFNDIAASFRLSGSSEPSTPSEIPSPEFVTYTDETNGFAISYPQNWQSVPQDLLTGRELIAFWDITQEDDIPTYLSVTSEQVSMEDVNVYYQASQEAIETQADGSYVFVSEGEEIINGVPAVKHIFTLSDIAFIHIYLLDGQTGWIINMWTSPDSFGELEPTLNEIASSFELLP